MEEEHATRPKPRLSPGIFRPSFASCSSRTLSDVVDKSFTISHRTSSQHRLPSMCKPITTPLEPSSGPVPVPKPPNDDSRPAFTLGDVLKGRLCPAAPAALPLNHPFKKLDDKKKHKRQLTLPRFEDQPWFSSDDEREEDEEEGLGDETDTLFSSISLSSDSSESHRQRASPRQRRRRRNREGVGILPMSGIGGNDWKNIKGSIAVVKRSSDPYGDFRSSMVEMIVEKQMFGAAELERLLQCFLALNSHHHHKVIVEVFTEIWEALFPHWS